MGKQKALIHLVALSMSALSLIVIVFLRPVRCPAHVTKGLDPR